MLGKSNTKDGRSTDAVEHMRRPLNRHTFAAAVLSSATPLFLGYDLAVVYNMAVRAQGDLKLLACTVALSCSLGMIAAVGTQRLIGDRRTVLLSAAVLCAGAIARGLAAFTAGVFVNGIGTGLALTAVPAYAAALSPCSARTVLAAHPDGLVYLGCILGSVVHSTMGFSRIPAHHAWWLTVAVGTAVPALLSAVVVLFMPETPRCWLVSRTLEEAELRLLEIKVKCGEPHDDGSDSDESLVAVTKRARWWREELGVLRELVVRPTEPLRRAVLTALVAKVFQQASNTRSVLQYVQRDVVGVWSRASLAQAVLVFVLVMSFFPMSLVLVELVWLLVRALARVCRLGMGSRRVRVPTGSGVTRRQEQLKWVRGLSTTMLLSLMALVWIALGPAPWAVASSRGCLRWLRAAVAAVKESVVSAI